MYFRFGLQQSFTSSPKYNKSYKSQNVIEIKRSYALLTTFYDNSAIVNMSNHTQKVIQHEAIFKIGRLVYNCTTP